MLAALDRNVQRLLRPVIVIVMAALGVHAACAQQRNLKFDRITNENGLSDNFVICTLLDRAGFLWAGTRDGLNRYDGNRIAVFRHDPKDPASLSDGSVGSLMEDHNGDLWIGTDLGGINRFDRYQNRFIHYRPSQYDPSAISPGAVRGMVEDSTGDIWLAVYDFESGLNRFRRSTGTFEHIRYDPADKYSISSNYLASICADRMGYLWIGTVDSGLNRFDPRTCTFLNHRTVPAFKFPKGVDHLFCDSKGFVWIISRGIAHVLDPSTYTITRYRNVQPPDTPAAMNYCMSVYRDRAGTVWMGTQYRGLEVNDERHNERFLLSNDAGNPYSLSGNQAQQILEDRAGNLWVATRSGLNKLNRRNWQLQYFQNNPTDTNSISPSVVRRMMLDVDGAMWIGFESGGLNRIDPITRRVHRYRPGPRPRQLCDKSVNGIYRDREGTLWLATNAGLNLYDPSTDDFRRYVYDPNDSTSLSVGGMWDVLEDRHGQLWVAALNGGLNRFDRATERFTHYYHVPGDSTSISNNQVLSLHEDRAGRFWVGTNAGLDLLDPITGRCLRSYRNDIRDSTSISNDRIWYIHEDAHGYLWIATSGGGVNKFDPRTGRAKRYMEDQGLVNNTVCAIIEDAHGRMWASTNNGISRIDPRTDEIRNYAASDGLLVHIFHFKSCMKDSSGFIYFGGEGGIVKFNPDSIAGNTHVPTVTITGFKTFDKYLALDTSILVKQQVDLERTNNFFTVEFAALDFTNPQRNRYRFKLEGIDDNWRFTDGQRPYVDYTEVPPGIYTFVVYGANNDGVESPTPRRLTVYIHPAFWQTWWFRLLCLLMLLGLASLAVILRIRSVRRKERLDRRLVEYQLRALRAQMNPHFIFNSLNSILHFVISHDSESAHTYLSKFSKLMRATLENSKSDTIALVDELESLRLYLELESLRFDNMFTYEITVSPDIDQNDVEIPPILIQPYVENAIKHGLAHRAGRGTLRVDIRRSGTYLLCSIIDNGIGRERSRVIQEKQLKDHRSYGMEATRNRLEVLSSLARQDYSVDVIDLMDDAGNPVGTRVDLYIPLESAQM